MTVDWDQEGTHMLRPYRVEVSDNDQKIIEQHQGTLQQMISLMDDMRDNIKYKGTSRVLIGPDHMLFENYIITK